MDIQPVACQLAKLRFFISLAIEQEPTGDRDDNYGIKPLPNLETRFIAADTLLGLHGQRVLSSDRRARVGTAACYATTVSGTFTPPRVRTKRQCRREDQRLRDELADELQQAWRCRRTRPARVAHWAPYEQKGERADWFDA